MKSHFQEKSNSDSYQTQNILNKNNSGHLQLPFSFGNAGYPDISLTKTDIYPKHDITKEPMCNSPLETDGNDLKMSETSVTAASNTSVVDIKVKQSACEI